MMGRRSRNHLNAGITKMRQIRGTSKFPGGNCFFGLASEPNCDNLFLQSVRILSLNLIIPTIYLPESQSTVHCAVSFSRRSVRV